MSCYIHCSCRGFGAPLAYEVVDDSEEAPSSLRRRSPSEYGLLTCYELVGVAHDGVVRMYPNDWRLLRSVNPSKDHHVVVTMRSVTEGRRGDHYRAQACYCDAPRFVRLKTAKEKYDGRFFFVREKILLFVFVYLPNNSRVASTLICSRSHGRMVYTIDITSSTDGILSPGKAATNVWTRTTTLIETGGLRVCIHGGGDGIGGVVHLGGGGKRPAGARGHRRSTHAFKVGVTAFSVLFRDNATIIYYLYCVCIYSIYV